MNDEMVIFDEVFCGYMFEFERTSVGAYRIRPHGGEHAPQSKPSSQNFNRTCVGAYRIRPHMVENAIETNQACSLLTCYFAPVKGVCDTPLHIFAQTMNLLPMHQ